MKVEKIQAILAKLDAAGRQQEIAINELLNKEPFDADALLDCYRMLMRFENMEKFIVNSAGSFLDSAEHYKLKEKLGPDVQIVQSLTRTVEDLIRQGPEEKPYGR